MRKLPIKGKFVEIGLIVVFLGSAFLSVFKSGFSGAKASTVSAAATVTSLDVRVATGNDDAEQRLSDGLMYLNSSDLELVNDPGVTGSVQSVGIRFTGVSVPKGAVITRAYVEFQVDEASSEATSVVFHGEATDNAAAFSSSTNNITNRARTSAAVGWNNLAAWSTVGAKVQSPDLTGLVQEIVNRGGWAAGNALVILVDGSGRRVASAFEASASAAPLLHVEYAASVNPTQPPVLPTSTPSTNPAGVSLNLQVSTGNDDAEQRLSDGHMYLNSSDLELITDPVAGVGAQSMGMRFARVTIPKGATITRAYIEFQVDESSNEATSLVLHGEASDNASGFTNASNNVTSRAKTAAAVSWTNVAAWTSVGAKIQTPDLSGLVQEIVNRSSWVAGNALVILVDGTGRRVAEAYEAGASAAPLLHIEYVPSGGPVPPTPAPTNTPVATTLPPTPTSTPVNNPSASTLNLRVAAGNDDVEQRQSDGLMYLNSTDLELINDPGVAVGAQSVGMRFTNVTLPKGATISRSYLEFQVDEASSEATSLLLHGQAVDNAPAFTTAANNVTTRSWTAASTGWTNISAWSTVGAKVQSPDLSPIVQEIVNRAGWVSGNALVILVDGAGRRVAEAYEAGASTAPLLHIEYLSSGGAPQPTTQPSPTPTSTPVVNPTPLPTSSSQPLPVGQTGNWRMVFNDEFSGSTLDKSKWHTCFWWADTTCSIETNKELELYNPEDVSVGNGMLTLRAQKRNMTAWNGSTYNYTSGMVMTGGRNGKITPGFTFTYGYAEARVLVPKGKGIWPAFWMLPVSYVSRPEIDIMEILGDTPTAYHMNYHYVGGDAGYTWNGPDFSAGWHVLGIDWESNAIVWYVDGVERWRYTNTANISKEPEYLLLNLAVGGTWPGSPDSATVFPSYFNIDYVRVWQK